MNLRDLCVEKRISQLLIVLTVFCYSPEKTNEKNGFLLLVVSDSMFMPSEASLPSGMGGRRPGATRPSAPPSKWDYVKTFYYDPVKW